jgi:hypothetical protein
MGKDEGAASRPLGPDHRREPRESAAALAVEHHLVRHQIDIIDQDKSNARGCGWFRRTDAG